MSYLLDKKSKQKRLINIFALVLLVLIVVRFRTGIFTGLSAVTRFIFHPVVVLGNAVGDSFSNMKSILKTRQALTTENENLQLQLAGAAAELANYNSISDENTKLKEILGRKKESVQMILASILSKPNQSPYDTLVIDAGSTEGIVLNARVFALGNVPIGYVGQVLPHTSKVVLYSNPGERTEVIVSGHDVAMQTVGRGAGNFELALPRDFTITNGVEVDLPGSAHYIIGNVSTVLSDPRDSFQKALVVSPVNIQELKYVQVEK